MIDAVLRGLRSDDAEDVLAAFQSNDDMSRQGRVTNLDEAQDYVRRLISQDSVHVPYAIDDGGRLVGLVCVSVDRENLTGWFWYWIHADYRGSGLVKRGATAVANWALNDGGLERLELGHRVNNPASGAVARAAGFIKEGTERQKFLVDGNRIDVDTYGRLRTDPVPQGPVLPMESCLH
ncbi:GNAT family N-acetyltransferase [Flaviflexus sp.]|uniref:GNAT family N-acetyltransferase n=1 Tax=Flaviflexus sp. TaxID=1969482 RepID=UPI003F90826C